MNNSSLVKYLKKFNKKDWREMKNFVRSPFFNQREDVIRLFDYLAKALSEATPLAVDKQKAYASTFPKQGFDEQQLRYVMSFLLSLVRQYLSFSIFENDKTGQQINLCKALRQRGLNQYFEKEWKKVKNNQDNRQLQDAHFHYQNYIIYQERYDYITQERRSEDMNLQILTDELTIFYIADILRQSCNILTHQIASQKNYQVKLLEEVLTHVEQNDYSHSPAVLIYYHSYKALSQLEGEQHFIQLKNLIDTNWQKFSEGEIKYIYLLAINYSIKKLNKGERGYIKEALHLYRSGLENKVLLENGILSNFTYHNILRLGLALKEYDWCSTFLDEYRLFLPLRDRDNTYHFNQAFLFFEKSDYNKAMQLLQNVTFKNVFNNLEARRLLLRSYFELGEYQALESLMDSSATYISRQKKLGYHKTNYLNLIRFIKKLLQLKIHDKEGKEKLRTEIEQEQAVAERAWLLSKL